MESKKIPISDLIPHMDEDDGLVMMSKQMHELAHLPFKVKGTALEKGVKVHEMIEKHIQGETEVFISQSFGKIILPIKNLKPLSEEELENVKINKELDVDDSRNNRMDY